METEYPWLVDARVEFECTRASICIISLFGSQSRNKTAGRAVGFYVLFFFRPSTYATLPREKREREKDKLRARNTNVRRVVFVSSTRRFCVSHGFHLYFQNGYARYFLYLLSPTHSFWLLVVFITRAPTWRPRNKRTKWLSSSLCRNPFVPPINYRRL